MTAYAGTQRPLQNADGMPEYDQSLDTPSIRPIHPFLTAGALSEPRGLVLDGFIGALADRRPVVTQGGRGSTGLAISDLPHITGQPN